MVKETIDGAIADFANEGFDMLKLMAFNGLATIKKIGVPQYLYEWFVSNDGKVEYDNGKLTL